MESVRRMIWLILSVQRHDKKNLGQKQKMDMKKHAKVTKQIITIATDDNEL